MIPLLVALYVPVQAEPQSPLRFHPPSERYQTLDDIATKHQRFGPLRDNVLGRNDYIHCSFPCKEKKHISCSFPRRNEKDKYIHCSFPQEDNTGYIHCFFPDDDE